MESFMKRPLACADFTFPLLEHEQSLQLISMMGFEGVDIGLFEGRSHLWPSREFENSAKSGARIGAMARDLELRIADVFLQMDPDFAAYAANHPEAARRAKARDYFERTLEYAIAAECRHITALPGVHFEGEPASESRSRCEEELAWRTERAKMAGLVFGVEAHVGSIAPTPDAALDLVRSVPGLTLTLDYTHFASRGIPDAESEKLLPHASHFHARGARRGRLQCSLKENRIDYTRVLAAMNEFGYSGWIGVEYVWIDWEHCNEVDNVSETILTRDFLRKLLVA